MYVCTFLCVNVIFCACHIEGGRSGRGVNLLLPPCLLLHTPGQLACKPLVMLVCLPLVLQRRAGFAYVCHSWLEAGSGDQNLVYMLIQEPFNSATHSLTKYLNLKFSFRLGNKMLNGMYLRSGEELIKHILFYWILSQHLFDYMEMKNIFEDIVIMSLILSFLSVCFCIPLCESECVGVYTWKLEVDLRSPF